MMMGREAVVSCRPDPSANLHTRHFRHHQVEDDEVRLFRIDHLPGLLPVIGPANGKPFPFEIEGDQFDDILFVIGNENLLLRHDNS